jgi:hypothetical protein
VEVSKNSVASPACTASLPLPSGKHNDFSKPITFQEKHSPSGFLEKMLVISNSHLAFHSLRRRIFKI